MKLILASQSPRRIGLLEDAGLDFKVIPSNKEEIINKTLSKEEATMDLAVNKARNVLSRFPNSLVVAADTIVYHNGIILGKPKDQEDAVKMLKSLSNDTHEVITGVAIITEDSEDVFYDSAKVTLKKLTDLEIKEYVETKEPMDKAGSYSIQGRGKELIDHYDGDFFTIMGLPLTKVIKKVSSHLND